MKTRTTETRTKSADTEMSGAVADSDRGGSRRRALAVGTSLRRHAPGLLFPAVWLCVYFFAGAAATGGIDLSVLAADPSRAGVNVAAIDSGNPGIRVDDDGVLKSTNGHLILNRFSGGLRGSFVSNDPNDSATLQPRFLVNVIHEFRGGNDGAFPTEALIRAPGGGFYGTTPNGGTSRGGTAFQMSAAGIVTVLHAFCCNGTPGGSPFAPLLLGIDGNLYGTIAGGGEFNSGAVFQMTPSGMVTILHSFTGGAGGGFPFAALVATGDGSFYGTTRGGISRDGTIFKIATDGTFQVAHAFAGTDGESPNAVIRARNGDVYGTTSAGGVSGLGTIFRMTAAGAFTVLHEFRGGTDGARPKAALVEAADGSFYGTTLEGGTSGLGTVFQMTSSGLVAVLHAFAGGPDGANPSAELIQADDGPLYGTSSNGGVDGLGTIFRIGAAGVLTTLHSFRGGSDGATPVSALVQGIDGDFYGMTQSGGSSDLGVVFRLSPE